MGLMHWGIRASAVTGDCDKSFVEDVVLAEATENDPEVPINCHLTLTPNNIVTKRIILAGGMASGTTIDCNGATLDGSIGTVNEGQEMIEIRSEKSDLATQTCMEKCEDNIWVWDRPEDITVKNCNIIGAIRVWGMARNGEGEDLRCSSRCAGHVTRARDNAPTRITFDNITITRPTSEARIPFYVAPGVTHLQLTNSPAINGRGGVVIYLDAESSQNLIKNNRIHRIEGNDREVMAVDGSSYNKIVIAQPPREIS
jgi:hypothetical protein